MASHFKLDPKSLRGWNDDLGYLCKMSDKILKKTLVLGASDNPERYSWLALNRLREHGHPVVAIGSHKAVVAGVDIETQMKKLDNIDTVTMYLNPKNQQGYYQDIIAMKPKRIIFNPGAENRELEAMATENGILVLEACTLVLLGTGRF